MVLSTLCGWAALSEALLFTFYKISGHVRSLISFAYKHAFSLNLSEVADLTSMDILRYTYILNIKSFVFKDRNTVLSNMFSNFNILGQAGEFQLLQHYQLKAP